MEMTPFQRQVIEIAADHTIYLEGHAGSGKTTAAIARLMRLLDSGVQAKDVLILVPQAVLAIPYHRAIRDAKLPAGGKIEVLTFGGLVLNTIKLFWAQAAKRGGFRANLPPSFLTLETAQYVMAKIVDPLMDDKGYFESVTIDRSRLYSQIIDNLEKAALGGFPTSEIGERLDKAWIGDSAQRVMFQQVQECADRYRKYCKENNLLDFSLQVEVFRDNLWGHRERLVRDYWMKRHPHLLVDNAEEGTPVMHRVVRDWLKQTKSGIVVVDTEAGFRQFLSADTESAAALKSACKVKVAFEDSLVTSPTVAALGDELARALDHYAPQPEENPRDALNFEVRRFYPQMLTWVADEITYLVKNQGVPAGEIVVLAPYLSDALRFTLMKRLEGEGIPVRSHRPSRALREEPAVRCLVTLAQLAHPEWGLTPSTFDVAYMFMQAIGSAGVGRTMDLIRAQLLANEAYPHSSKARLCPFEELKPETQERITYVIAPRYEGLRRWIEEYIAEREQIRDKLRAKAKAEADAAQAAAQIAPPVEVVQPKTRGRKKKSATQEAPVVVDPSQIEAPVRLDHFFSRLFGEVLSQRGFGFHNDFDAATAAGNLVDSAGNFRRGLENRAPLVTGGVKNAAHEYIRMIERGLIADQYVRAWTLDEENTNAVLIAPAYTFLMRNQPVDVQFWLDIGNRGWFERLYQPLTHPYVLRSTWNINDKWTDEHEFETRRRTLFHLVMGLIRRCRKKVYLGLSELGESGYESQGELLAAFNKVLRRLNAPPPAEATPVE